MYIVHNAGSGTETLNDIMQHASEKLQVNILLFGDSGKRYVKLDWIGLDFQWGPALVCRF